MTDRLFVSQACDCHISGDERELCRMHPGVFSRRQRPVACELGWASALQVFGDLAVEHSTTVRSYSQVQRLAHQIVCECTRHNHPGSGRFDEQGCDVGLGHPRDTSQDADVRRTDHAGHLKQLERLLGQPGEPVLEDLPYTRRDRPRRRTAAHLEPRHLGGEERVAAGSPVHVGDVIQARFDAHDVLYQGGGRAPVEAGQRESWHAG